VSGIHVWVFTSQVEIKKGMMQFYQIIRICLCWHQTSTRIKKWFGYFRNWNYSQFNL